MLNIKYRMETCLSIILHAHENAKGLRTCPNGIGKYFRLLLPKYVMLIWSANDKSIFLLFDIIANISLSLI